MHYTVGRYTTYDLKTNIEVKSQSGAMVYLELLYVLFKILNNIVIIILFTCSYIHD